MKKAKFVWSCIVVDLPSRQDHIGQISVIGNCEFGYSVVIDILMSVQTICYG